jgi:hypothetical protein
MDYDATTSLLVLILRLILILRFLGVIRRKEGEGIVRGIEIRGLCSVTIWSHIQRCEDTATDIREMWGTRLDAGHDEQRVDGWRRLDRGQCAVGIAAFGYIDEDTVGGVFCPG